MKMKHYKIQYLNDCHKIYISHKNQLAENYETIDFDIEFLVRKFNSENKITPLAFIYLVDEHGNFHSVVKQYSVFKSADELKERITLILKISEE